MTPLLFATSLAALVSCNGDTGDDTGDPEAPTYYQDIAPILSENCMVCHTEGGMQPGILFDDAETTGILSGAIDHAVSDGQMPPFYAEETDECPNPWGFERDPRLTQEEEDLIAAWAAAGGPVGDADNPATLPPPPSTDLADSDMTVFPAGKWTTSEFGEAQDEFICFSIDPGLTSQEWLEAFQVIPDDLEVVHHVLVGLDTEGTSAGLVDENGTYPCFGGFGADVTATFTSRLVGKRSLGQVRDRPGLPQGRGGPAHHKYLRQHHLAPGAFRASGPGH